jgi:3-methyl-2-oxobutanoate hydroxymethyltransferase
MPYATAPNTTGPRKALNLPRLQDMRGTAGLRAEKIAMLTCYDASFAALLDHCGVDVLLVGDSLGMVLQGESSTMPVTVEHIEYHTRCVARGNKTAWVLADMPWASYHESPAQAFANAARLMAAGAQMVKLEGTNESTPWLADTVRFLVERGIPVCAHIGLTPQTAHALGGYRVQGKTPEAAARLKQEAALLQAAGAQMLLFEMVPASLAAEITAALNIPTIGIGAGKDCSGQVLVLHDMLGIFPGKMARFVKNFSEADDGLKRNVEEAVRAYVVAVKDGSFPGAEHAY